MRRILYVSLLILFCAVSVQAQNTNPDYFVEAEVSNTAPFVGQQIIYRFRLYTTISLPDTPYMPPDFQGFWKSDMGPPTSYFERRNDRAYTVVQLETVLYPTYPGELLIEPAAVTLPDTVFQDGETLKSNSITIQSRPVPDGAPEGFGGAVGDFTMQAMLDRQSLTQGEPFTLRLIVTGSGNVEQLPAPPLPLPDDWRVYPNPTVYRSMVQNGILVGEKTFEWQIAPSQAGAQTLPEITLHYFDPANLVFRSASTTAVTVDVQPADEAPMPIATVASNSPALIIKPIPASLQNGPTSPGVFFWLLWLLPPTTLGGVWWWMRRQNMLKNNRLKNQQSRALLRAKEHLQAARKMQPEVAYRRTAEAILTYAGDKLDISPTNLVQSDLRELMLKSGAPEILVGNVLACLEWADRGRYAPIADANTLPLIEQTYKALAAVDATWKTV